MDPGKKYISVSDLDILSEPVLSKDNLSAEDIFMSCGMSGGYLDSHDYHVVGLNEEFLM